MTWWIQKVEVLKQYLPEAFFSGTDAILLYHLPITSSIEMIDKWWNPVLRPYSSWSADIKKDTQQAASVAVQSIFDMIFSHTQRVLQPMFPFMDDLSGEALITLLFTELFETGDMNARYLLYSYLRYRVLLEHFVYPVILPEMKKAKENPHLPFSTANALASKCNVATNVVPNYPSLG